MKPKTMLGLFIKERREELGLSVHELADRCDLTESAIYYIERGDRKKLQPETFAQLATALSLPVEALFAKAVSPRKEEVVT